MIMKNKIKRSVSIVCSALLISIGMLNPTTVNAAAEINKTETLTGTEFTGEVASSFKSIFNNNPISSKMFCADPTAVEYNGRLYVFGTSDHQQYLESSPDKDNTYEKIKSLAILSTDDMVNWVYHGEINVGEIAPWIMNSWAPSITSRVEDDGLTHFYLYFSNNGTGVGVITATDPLGPWSDPLGEPLINYNTPGLTDCPNPFDPGVVIDDDGIGWLSFGGGKAKDGTDFMPGTSRIVRLGEDMLSFDSDFMEIPAPYFFEASELNFINGTYVYTYCSDWNSHYVNWNYDAEVPSACSMVYMTTKTPLDPESWVMKGECFKNPGLSGFDNSNNHTHMHKFNGEWYMFYQSLFLRRSMGIQGGYRSICAEKINVDEETVTIEKSQASEYGYPPQNSKIPYVVTLGADINSEADTFFDTSDMSAPLVISANPGAWTSVRNVMFTQPEGDDIEKIGFKKNLSFIAEVRGSGRVEVRVDSPDGAVLTSIDFDSADEFSVIYSKSVKGVGGFHDLYFVFSDKDIAVRNWQFCTADGFNNEFPLNNSDLDISKAVKADGGFWDSVLSFAAKYGVWVICAVVVCAAGVVLLIKLKKSKK